jgi:predicted transcriptional regulator
MFIVVSPASRNVAGFGLRPGPPEEERSMARAKPSELELQVLSVLWREGPSTVRRLLERMPDGKKRSYTTILSVLQVMEGKKLVTHRNEGRAHVYRPLVQRNQVLGPMLRNMVKRVFGGSTCEAVQHLLDENAVGADELAAIQQLLEEARVEKQKQSYGRHGS